MSKSKGFRKKTRHILRKKIRDRGKNPLGRLLHKYNAGAKVVITIDPSVHKSMPDRRYHGKVGMIAEKRGRAYVVKIEQGSKTRQLIVRPEHITPHNS